MGKNVIALPLTGKELRVPQPRDTDEYISPAVILDPAREVLGGAFDLDPASSYEANQYVQADQFFSVADDGLTKDWCAERLWLNPPFSWPLVQLFVDKLLLEYAEGRTRAGVCLTNSSTSANWYQWLLERAEAFCILEKRLQFRKPLHQREEDRRNGKKKTGNQYAQTVWYLGPQAERFAEVFDRFGYIQRRAV